LSRLSSFGIKFNATETLLATKIAAATFRYTGKCLAQVAVINEVSESIASEFLASLGTASLFPALLYFSSIGTKNTLLERLGQRQRDPSGRSAGRVVKSNHAAAT
jgi:hypothetical protein